MVQTHGQLNQVSYVTSNNTLIYNLSSGPHITRFSAAVAKKRKISSKCLF